MTTQGNRVVSYPIDHANVAHIMFSLLYLFNYLLLKFVTRYYLFRFFLVQKFFELSN